MPEVSIFGKELRICLIGPSSCRRTCETGTIVSPASSRDERAAAVYITHPYLWNRSPACVTTWSRGIGPSTATLRLAWLLTSFVTNTSGACRLRPRDVRACGHRRPLPGSDRLCGSPTLRLQPTSDRPHGARRCLDRTTSHERPPGQRPGGLVAPPPVEAPATPGELGGASSYWVRCDLCGFAEPGASIRSGYEQLSTIVSARVKPGKRPTRGGPPPCGKSGAGR